MKKTFLLIFLIIISLRIFAVPVSINEATDVAVFYLEMYYDSFEVDTVVEFKDDMNVTIAYIANLSPLGFIALSINTDIQPIISYSVQNDFAYDSNPNNVLYHMLLNDMTGRIDAMNSGTLPDVLNKNDLWEYYITQDTTYFNQREEQYWPPQGPNYPTEGWLQTLWHQGGIHDDFCPIDPATSNRSMAGCVAIAISQVLNFHEYIGNRIWTTGNDCYISMEGEPSEVYIDQEAGSYDFPRFSSIQGSFSPLNTYLDNLRSTYNSINPIPSNDEIAALCYVSGVAVEMDYSSGGSGILYSDYSNHLIDKFNYYTADQEYNLPSIYIANLIPNMKNAQPAIINLVNNFGHAVVCDGYWINDEYEDYFHINFGWGGASNSWYDLPDFPFNYNFYNSPIYNISPPGCHGLLSGTVSLNSGDGQITDVTITAGNKTTHPDATGYYEIELYNGNYEVSAYLFGYDESITEVEITANQNTDNIDFVLDVSTPNYIYIPTHYSSIQDGIDAAVDGDIIIVLEGEYFENINFNGKKIIVASFYYVSHNEAYIDNTIINGNDNGRVVTFDHGEDLNSSLVGFTITDGYLSSSHGAGIDIQYSSPTLKKLIITGNQSGTGAGLFIFGSESTIQDIEVFNNTCSSIYNDHAAVYCSNSNCTLKNVIVSDNNKVGITINGTSSSVILENVSVIDNGWEGDGYEGIYIPVGEISMNNCVIWSNNNGEEQIYHGTNSTLSIDYSDIQGGSPVAGVGNIDEEPLVDENYKPLWTETDYSPLIDTGDPSILDPDGTPSDIGAVRARGHKIDSIELIEMTEGINWKCLPVIDTVFADYDIASHIFYDIQQPPYPAALNLIEFQDENENISYYNGFWHNNSQQFTSDLGCKIHMNDSFTMQITGFLEDPYHVIDLELGDNWIGYYLEDSMKPLDAFEAILDDIDMIQTKTFTLNKTVLGWLGAANWTINYGDLVVVHCTNNCSFYWGEDGGGTTEKSSRSSSQDFDYTEEADYLPVYVELDNQAVGNPTEIGLFVNGECKGAEVITDSLVQLRAYVLNDTTVFDPGDMELQLSYGSRSLNITITDFKVKHDILDEWESNEKYVTQDLQNYYLISLTDTENDIPVVNRTTLSQNYPNPFNPTTTINYSIAKEGTVELTVYNIKGQKVKTLVNERKEAGQHSIVWNGKDNTNKTVSSGIYFYSLSTGKKNMKKKMLLLK